MGGFVFGTGYRPVNGLNPSAAGTPAGTTAPLPTAVPVEPIKLYDFENGSVMGWRTKEAASFIEVMKVPAKGGTKALQVRLNHTNMSNQGYAQVKPPPNFVRGRKRRLFAALGMRQRKRAIGRAPNAWARWLDQLRAAEAPDLDPSSCGLEFR